MSRSGRRNRRSPRRCNVEPVTDCATFRLEAAKDDYRIRCEELEKELLDVKSQNEELTALADEAQSLKDEMDVLR